MNNLRKFFSNLFSSVSLLPAGIHHYQSPPDDPRNYRLHLRLEEDGTGVLIVNASTVLHLNQTAAEYAYYLVQNLSPTEAATQMSARYQISKNQAEKDYLTFAQQIQVLVETPDLDPITFLDFERKSPSSGHLSAPYRLDCAITYRLPQEVLPESAPLERVKAELCTDDWKRVFEKSWKVGIPHIVFTGGEPTLRDDLPELLAYAESLGQVTGLISDGVRLADQQYLERLLQTGLDHLMIVLDPTKPEVWQAIENSLAADLHLSVHLTIAEENLSDIFLLIDRLGKMGVHAISLSAVDEKLNPTLQAIRDKVAQCNIDLVWNLPVPYSALNPIALEEVSTSDKSGLYIEPDGDVLPAQGITQVLGNMLTDTWDTIWKP